MKTFKTIPPKQKYMSIPEMYRTFGSCGIIAYSCKVVDSVLEGGVVCAVQNENEKDTTEIKAYMNNMRKKHPDKKPFFYLSIKPGEKNQRYSITYDNGGGEKTLMPKLEVRKSESEEKIESVPVDFIAQALAISLERNKDGNKE